ncbi:hypothetical protein NP233_g6051 [Leucocoprinus birnbaumii]|uniref:Uncharacterized protein n=1 Tax=Leucocoprinus birnbaumii TaxID=56174 RepID=A0AAD5VRQ0_9AGAR|nr:hypothetical protein NP233_g6051 [Leucocoprinus birnbaumii]
MPVHFAIFQLRLPHHRSAVVPYVAISSLIDEDRFAERHSKQLLNNQYTPLYTTVPLIVQTIELQGRGRPHVSIHANRLKPGIPSDVTDYEPLFLVPQSNACNPKLFPPIQLFVSHLHLPSTTTVPVM